MPNQCQAQPDLRGGTPLPTGLSSPDCFASLTLKAVSWATRKRCAQIAWRCGLTLGGKLTFSATGRGRQEYGTLAIRPRHETCPFKLPSDSTCPTFPTPRLAAMASPRNPAARPKRSGRQTRLTDMSTSRSSTRPPARRTWGRWGSTGFSRSLAPGEWASSFGPSRCR